ncbi:hypothetical protein PV797_04940 [Clostridiaceae bacterium M8S5]|nr:hypothetical protein PV797_04940 [Clostridiaceae bacterium M8S5]
MKRTVKSISFDKERLVCFLEKLYESVSNGKLSIDEANNLILELVNSDNEAAKNEAEEIIFNWIDNMNVLYIDEQK